MAWFQLNGTAITAMRVAMDATRSIGLPRSAPSRLPTRPTQDRKGESFTVSLVSPHAGAWRVPARYRLRTGVSTTAITKHPHGPQISQIAQIHPEIVSNL